MSNDLAAALQVQNISKCFANHVVLDDITFEVQRGDVLGLVGLNGIGKTTMIKIILGLLESDEGSVSLFGCANDDMAVKQKLAYLPEKFQPSILLKGQEFLSLSLGYYKKKYDTTLVEQLCVALDFDVAALHKCIRHYSKGMGQKLGLVFAFLVNAQLLILDEPMSGLDPTARILLKQQIKNYVKNTNNAIFFSSHILSDIEEVCNKIAILHNGKLYYFGPVQNFVQKYNTTTLEQAFLHIIQN
jgi:ABC-type multidrug transport system ATPase subunit